MCHEENGFSQDTPIFHDAVLLTPSISAHIHQTRHTDGDTVNNALNYGGGWKGRKQLHRGEDREEGKEGGGVNHREKRWRAESSENRSPERIRTVRYREEKKKMKDTQDEDMTSSKRGEGLIITERLWRMWGGNTSAPASQLLRDILSSLYMTPTADLWIHAVN